MSCSESWQPGPAKVTAAFARGPAHFRSCLAKLCSTWWLVRSHKSTTSSAPVRTHTLPGNGGRRADGVTLTTIEINSWLVLQLSRWLVVSGNHKSRRCLWGGWLSDCRKEMSLKRQIFDKTVFLCPSAFTERKKTLFSPLNSPHLVILIYFCISLMEVLRLFTPHLWRQTSLSLSGPVHIRLYSPICKPEHHARHTEEVIYLLWNTSALLLLLFFSPAIVKGEIQGRSRQTLVSLISNLYSIY